MRERTFGRTGVSVPVVGQGTWNMEHDDVRSCVAAIRRGLDLGMTHVDTAELYGSGTVEEIVAEAIDGRREGVFLVSKVVPENASRRGTLRHCEESLRRLRTDHLDCYLLHWPGRHPIEGTVTAFRELVRDGKIRAWGVSNFDESELDELLEIADADEVACNQVLYHLEERAIEHAVVPFCEAQGIALVGYSPFGSGRFPTPQSEGGRALAIIAEDRGVTARQVALAFLTRHACTFAIPKASRVAHVEENAGAGDLVLTDGEIARLDEAFPRGPRRRGVPTL